MRKRKVEITVETDRIILSGRRPRANWCEKCGATSMTVSIEQAATIAQTDQLAIRRLIESGRLHGFEVDDSCTRVCLGSLLNVLTTPSSYAEKSESLTSMDRDGDLTRLSPK